MFRGLFIVLANTWFLIAAIFVVATPAFAQHHGGHGVSIGGYVPERPDGVDDKDDLKDYQHLIAVQATTQQVAEFQVLLKTIDDAKAKVGALNTAGQPAREAAASIDQAIQIVRTGHQKFEEGFSEAQKSGLKKITKRIEHFDFELDRTSKRLDQIVQRQASQPEISAALSEVDKSLSDFSSDQLALGKEMSIILANETAFTLPGARKQVSVGSQSITMQIFGSLSQSRIDNNLRTFQIEMAADLSEIGQNVDAIMKSQIDDERNCGEQLYVRHATLSPATPASSLLLLLHYERWSCIGRSANELAESDGSVEVKLTPAFDKANSLTIGADLKRIDASGMMESSLRTGNLGDELRERIAHSMLALARGADFKAVIPHAIQNAVHLDRAAFENGGGGLRLTVSGNVQLSNEQVRALTDELNQNLSAQSANKRTR